LLGVAASAAVHRLHAKTLSATTTDHSRFLIDELTMEPPLDSGPLVNTRAPLGRFTLSLSRVGTGFFGEKEENEIRV
jgi:hypothetical protein